MERQIQLEGCLNFRDLGGYPSEDGRRVRWRQLFRSDALHLLTAADLKRLRDELGIGVIVDLRSTAELRAEGQGPLTQEPLELHHLPLFDGGAREREARPELLNLADRYFLLAEFAHEKIARVITTLADVSSPAVFHCAAGKDRTGVISAVLLGILGVRDEVIIADYAATQENLEAIIARLMANEGYQTMLEALPPDTLHAEPGTMISFLERVRDKYGSMRDYARAGGVAETALERLTARLLERD